MLDFQPGGDFRLRVISNDDGSEAVEASHRFNFDVWSRRLRPPPVRARLRIGRVTVEGATSPEEAQLRSRMRLTPASPSFWLKPRISPAAHEKEVVLPLRAPIGP